MKAALVSIQANCSLEMTESEIALLHHYASYGEAIAKALYDVSDAYTTQEIMVVLQQLREATGKVISSTKDAKQFLFDDRYTSIRRRNPVV